MTDPEARKLSHEALLVRHGSFCPSVVCPVLDGNGDMAHGQACDNVTAIVTSLSREVATLRAALEPLAAIGNAVLSQDNRITASPIFVVQQHRRTYGFDPQYTEDCVAWLCDHAEVTDEEFESLEAKWDETGDEPDGYTRTAYVDTWEYVMPFFTEKAAQRYIDENGHNLKSPRIYAESAYRNHEWDAIRQASAAAARLALTPAGPT